MAGSLLLLLAAIAGTGAGRAAAGLVTASSSAHAPRVGRVTAVLPPPRNRSNPRARAAGGAPLDGLHAVWRDTQAIPHIGSGGPIVAIVDSGADIHHPSLRDHLWTNPGEVPGNGLDDDHNGYVDDVNGTNILAPGTPLDGPGSWHGTAVAGLVAAGTQDGGGVSGAAPGARLMIVRVIGAEGQGDTTQLAEGIQYAVRNGASVINCSVTTSADYPTVDRAIASAADAGIPVVAAAGNDARSLDSDPIFPAATDSPAVIAVAATTADGKLAGFSNFGRENVDVAAPGVDIDTTYPESSFIAMSGTSTAAPLVSATLALERAVKPAATLAELRDALLTTADRTGLPVASGRLNAQAAVASLEQAPGADDGGTRPRPARKQDARPHPLAPQRLARRPRASGAAHPGRLGDRTDPLDAAAHAARRPGNDHDACGTHAPRKLWLELATLATAQRPGSRAGRLVKTR